MIRFIAGQEEAFISRKVSMEQYNIHMYCLYCSMQKIVGQNRHFL